MNRVARPVWGSVWRRRMEAPLVSEYKVGFIYRRILQTLLGGARLALPFKAPLYIYAIQVMLLLIITSLISVPLFLEGAQIISFTAAILISIISVFLICITLHGLSRLLTWLANKKAATDNQSASGNRFAGAGLTDDEEVFEFDGIIGSKSWQFIVPPRSSILSSVLQAVVAAFTAACVIYFNRPSHINQLTRMGMPVSVALSVLTLCSATAALYGVIATPPPEPAVFRPHLPFDLALLSRPTHLCSCALIHLIHSLYPQYVLLHLLNCCAHLVAATAFILWVVGCLPPIDAYLLWLLEFCHVVLYGGSATASTGRLLVHIVMETVTFIALLFLASSHYTTLAIASSIRGVSLSYDYVFNLMACCSKSSNSVFDDIRNEDATLLGESRDKSSSKKKKRISPERIAILKENILRVLSILMTLAVGLLILMPHKEWFNNSAECRTRAQFPGQSTSGDNSTSDQMLVSGTTLLSEQQLNEMPSLFKKSARLIIGWCWIGLSLIVMLITAIKQVYLFGLIKNPLWSDSTSTEPTFHYIVAQTLTLGLPVVGVIGLHIYSASDHCLLLSQAPGSLQHVIYIIAMTRAFRTVWTVPYQSVLQLSLLFLFDWLLVPSHDTLVAHHQPISLLSLMHHSSPLHLFTAPATLTCVRFMVISLAWLYCARVWRHLLALTILVTSSVNDLKQRRPVTIGLAVVCLVGLPVLMLQIIAASVLAAPLLPLFTLPLYFIGFPRPQKFWPYPVGHSANTCSDSAYYKQLCPNLVCVLHQHMQSGVFGLIEAGQHYLLRFEDRFIWVHVLEVGYLYAYYSIKGLELQETSCHTAEASKVDAVLSRAFDDVSSSDGISKYTNMSFFNTLTPVTRVSIVAYSDTKNVLTGVIDSADFLNLVPEYFTKCLLYMLMDSIMKQRERQSLYQSSVPSDRPDDILNETLNNNSEVVEYKQQYSTEETDASMRKQSFSTDIFSETNKSQNNSRDGSFKLPALDVNDDSKDNRSLQSGRGSRLAWVNRDKLNMSSESPIAQWEDDAFDVDRLHYIENIQLEQSFDTQSVTELSKRHGSKSSRETIPLSMKALGGSPLSPAARSNQSKNRPNISQSKSIPGFLFERSNDNYHLNDSGTEASSLLGTDRSVPNNSTAGITKVNLRILSRTELRPSSTKPCKSSTAEDFCPPSSWITDVPMSSDSVDDFQAFFPISWYHYLLGHFYRLRLQILMKKNNESFEQKTKKSDQKSSNAKPTSAAEGKYGSTNKDFIRTSNHNSDTREGEHSNENAGASLQEVLQDENLEETYRLLLAVCQTSIIKSDNSSPRVVLNTFMEQLPSSNELLWLQQLPALHELTLKAYKIAVKISLDHVLIGINSSSWPDLVESLNEYNTRWYFGVDEEVKSSIATDSNGASRTTSMDSSGAGTSGRTAAQGASASRLFLGARNKISNDETLNDTQPLEGTHELCWTSSSPKSWTDAVSLETPNLFTIGYNDVKGAYTSHLATLQQLDVGAGRLSDSAVTSLWSALVPELLYLTNDDDERYSIQAHTALLRNLTIQAADPPLGYPIYASPAIRMGPTYLCPHTRLMLRSEKTPDEE